MKPKYKGRVKNDYEKEFLKRFNDLCYSRTGWQVWTHLMGAIACSIANATDRTPEHYEAREKEFERCIRELGGVEIPSELFGIIVMALEDNPDQDFLGAMYMNLNLGSHWHGQFFTPYNVSHMMARMTIGDCKAQVEKEGWISVCDPTIGAGGMIIAAANAMKEQGVNYQTHALFVGQDIDRVVAQMAYIQLSLLGCAGYIAVGNTLTNPLTGPVLFPIESEGLELWYTPMFFSDVWHYRRLWYRMDKICGAGTAPSKPREKEHFTYFFNFDEEEQNERAS